MKITELLTDESILAELGRRIARRRIDLQMTQAEVAEQAGVGKRTLERLEAGQSAQMSSLIRIVRALGALPDLDRMIPEVGPRPMELLKRKGKVPRRASKRRSPEEPEQPWSWDDQS
jgi:transcriptional regulator with XRE-family HTH domain